MRGVVTLTAAQLLPAETPHRDVLVLIAVVVTVGTLLLQGTTLPALARRLGVHGPDPRQDALQAATVMQLASRAALEVLDAETDLDEVTRERLRERTEDRVNQLWERLGRRGADVSETPSEQYRRVRMAMLDAERAAVLDLRDAGRAEHEVLRVVLSALDLEETMLDRVEDHEERIREQMLPVEAIDAPCEHLEDAGLTTDVALPGACAECHVAGTSWVHLRLCLECGHVGCCNSSSGRHADAHFRETGHPVMRSIEPGESWRWCYVDELLG
jgi:CPA1 family monovalent cation:H+ antiporter